MKEMTLTWALKDNGVRHMTIKEGHSSRQRLENTVFAGHEGFQRGKSEMRRKWEREVKLDV